MIKQILIIFLLINIFSISGLCATVALTSSSYNDEVNMTANSNDILSEIIIIIPKESLSNVDTINALQFPCATYPTPNQNLIIRFFKYYGLGAFSPIDNTYILPSQCLDFAYLITWNLYDIETVDHNYDYAVGFYSNSVTDGKWRFIYLSDYGNLSNPQSYSWLNTTDYTPIINVSIIDMDGFDYIDNGSNLRNFPYFKVFGTLESPTPTPTPTPIPDTTPDINSTDNWYGDNTTYDSGSGDSPYNTIPNSTGFDTILREDGLCVNSSGSCTSGDAIEWLTRYIYDIFILTFILVIYKVWSMKQ